MAKQRKAKFQATPDPRPNPVTERSLIPVTVSEEPAAIRTRHDWKDSTRALMIPGLAAVYSRVSLLALAPVYGSTPAHMYHETLCNTAILAGSFLYTRIPNALRKAENILPALAISIPIFQSFLFQQSSRFGNPAGPVLTELITICPLLLLSMSSYSRIISNTSNLRRANRLQLLSRFIPLLFGVVLFRLADSASQTLLPSYIGSNVFMTTFDLQVIIACIYSFILPSYLSWVLFMLPGVYLYVTSDMDASFVLTPARVNSTLHEVGYSLVDRQESLTGYISVLDNVELGFRAMRCDHSLLGGQWTSRPSDYNPRVSDPIYAVFTMLEAVRLVEPDSSLPEKEDKDSNALVIGLGIGTTPAALIQHGIDTTIVEIDPVVYNFALQHFGFPQNHTAVIDDAVSFVETARYERMKYDYIIHDVFTGGVEPVELFTLEFMQGLDALLEDDGVIAINYAGDVSLPGAGVVIRTIKTVFPECRIFRENDGSETPAEESLEFINMVVFCKKTRTPPLTFRQPNEGDYLGSQSRKSYMVPRREIDHKIFGIGDDSTDQRLLEVGKTDVLESYHTQNAIGHWNIMRKVLPAKVWENY
ncbi:spermine/spermidine synthase family protein [Talaromyces stipitatus ATCC 10500]|uniref:Spermine/spermidine synthase family protein n=1 Tax=Talaromyces stipitatus (strain ATCC 10500 / CBS 375.48 / QM 6759 / NRRL 1006) TaxID=441959 RepID=B8MD82_TALSN|nr:spermine/spermidine synthase family protein [Talaromyces stipitatus ATCC 10500]EED17607.1 spermine/spermidine synthase family protein [Talaromyces stipitatus ATCC 10500]